MDRETATGVLGLTASASSADAEAAFRNHAKSVHPDVGGDHHQMVLVQQAIDSLRLQPPTSELAQPASTPPVDTEVAPKLLPTLIFFATPMLLLAAGVVLASIVLI